MEHIEQAKLEIPTINNILDLAWDNLKIEPKYVKKRFGDSVVSLDIEATRIFRNYERIAIKKLADLWISAQKVGIKEKFRELSLIYNWDVFINTASEIFVEFGILVQNMEKDLGNMRKARGGRTFELIVTKLLKFIKIKCEMPIGKGKEDLKRIDIVIPDVMTASKMPDKAFFLTCKRTLRERWKQEVPQARLNQRFYLLTIDPSLSESKALEINEKQLIAFVRHDLTQIPNFKKFNWIRSLNDLPKFLNEKSIFSKITK